MPGVYCVGRLTYHMATYYTCLLKYYWIRKAFIWEKVCGFGVVKEKKVASVSEQGKHTWEIILV